MYIILVGCGRVGAQLATMLSQEGHAVVVVDSDPNSFNRLSENFSGSTIQGNGIDEDVLRGVGIERADAVVTATNGDNTNIMVAQIAQRIYGVERVVARCYDPVRSNAYEMLGLKTICPTTVGAEMLREAIVSEGDE
ncbi:MAG: TrkA family potassium uptake protein [Chloroflexota bacterium]|jgi:trk system potassium uptake protein TrkA|nr:TrkA family potassium uptake protein [Chloroflexota bacterium]